jgi:8-oxo-dGTP pyrophosphatase MutT (NUDIX family)
MKFEIEYKGEIYDCEWSDNTEFEKLPMLNQSSGFIFNEEGEVCLVNVKKKQGWCIPGGKVEKFDNSPEETFIRETKEEADIELKEIKRLGYFKTVPRKNPEKTTYSTRFVAKVKKINPQTIDPSENIIPERKFISPKDFDNYTQWGENGIFQLNKALEKIK